MPAARVRSSQPLAATDSGTGDPVVLVHGLAGSRALWDRQIPALVAAGFRAIAVDLRGHGDSPSPRKPWSIDDFARDLLRLVDDLGIQRAALVGHSLGGRAAFSFALAHPERLAALVAVGAHSEAPSGPYRSVLERVRASAAEGGLAAFTDAFRDAGEIPLRATANGAASACYWKDFARNRPADLVAALDAILAMPTLTPRLGEIRAPFLALVGADDRPFLELAARYATLIPAARTHVVADCGHYPMVDAPSEFETALVQFLVRAREARSW